MSELHTVVCMKVVPKPEEIKVDPQSHRLVRDNARSEMNPPDMNALEMALRLKDKYGGRITVLSMGPPFFEPFLRIGVAMGADEVCLLSDPRFGGADTLATTYTLAKGIVKLGGADVILCGEESSDGATGQVPPGLAEWMNLPQITLATELDVDLGRHVIRARREIPGGYQVVEAPLPVVISAKTASNEPRFMDFQRKPWAMEEADVEVWSCEDLGAEEEMIGVLGSPTIVTGLDQAPSHERKREFLEGSPEKIAKQLVERLGELIG